MAAAAAHIFDLPVPVLSSIIARVSDPVDVASLLCSCTTFQGLSKSVPFCIKVWSSKLDTCLRNGCSTDSRLSTTSVGIWTRKALAAVRRQLLTTRILDLSGCWIVDEDVTAVLADLRFLQVLILDDCQRLTSTVADVLAVSVRSGPLALSVQRCFGLGPAAAGNLLAAAAALESHLQCILFSHLDRLDLPRDVFLMDVQDQRNSVATNLKMVSAHFVTNCSIGAGVRILALHNCSNIGMPELDDVARTCPMLEFLMLGGSVEGLGLCHPDSLTHEKMTAAVGTLVDTVDSLKNLLVLEITFFSACVTHSIREYFGESIEVWNLCDRESVFAAASFLACYKSSSGCRNTVKPVYESTGYIVNHEANAADDLYRISSGTLRSQDLNVTSQQDSFSNRQPVKNLAFYWNSKPGSKNLENISLAVRAASNCTDIRRRTPLHVAAACGDTHMVRGLLEIGSKVSGMKDSGGATALFVAAESGYAGVCDLLLKSGADVLSRNRAGENPLYIAALRGHPAAIEIMLSHCESNGVNWQSACVYGDRWTPLMAAAVADRQDVAKVLLQAAGAEKVSSQLREQYGDAHDMIDGSIRREHSVSECDFLDCETKSPQILDAQNRYGQTALHIAARRASVWFVSNLLLAGASLSISDNYGRRAIDIAKSYNHTLVTTILRQWERSSASSLSISDNYGRRTIDIAKSYNHTLVANIIREWEQPSAFSLQQATSAGNMESGSRHNQKNNGKAREKKCQGNTIIMHQHDANNSNMDSVVTNLPYTAITSGNTRKVWRVRGDCRKIHPDVHTTVHNK